MKGIFLKNLAIDNINWDTVRT